MLSCAYKMFKDQKFLEESIYHHRSQIEEIYESTDIEEFLQDNVLNFCWKSQRNLFILDLVGFLRELNI